MKLIRKITNADIIEDLQRELKKERKAYQIMHNDYETTNLEAAKYKRKYDEARDEYHKRCAKSEAHATAMSARLEHQAQKNERLLAENAELKADVDVCRKEIAALEKRVLKGADFPEVQDIVLEKEKLGRNWTPPLDTLLDIVSRKTKKEEILKNENDNLKNKIKRLDIDFRLKKEELVEVETERDNLRKWNQQAKEELNTLQERITFYEETENGNVHNYQTIIAKQNETIKNLKRGMKK